MSVDLKTGRHTMKTLKPIPGFSKYGITQCARLFNLETKRELRTSSNNGYQRIILVNDSGKSQKVSRHLGFNTGDCIRTIGGKYPNHTTRVVMTNGKVKLSVNGKITNTHIRNCKRIHRNDGYKYEEKRG